MSFGPVWIEVRCSTAIYQEGTGTAALFEIGGRSCVGLRRVSSNVLQRVALFGIGQVVRRTREEDISAAAAASLKPIRCCKVTAVATELSALRVTPVSVGARSLRSKGTDLRVDLRTRLAPLRVSTRIVVRLHLVLISTCCCCCCCCIWYRPRVYVLYTWHCCRIPGTSYHIPSTRYLVPGI